MYFNVFFVIFLCKSLKYLTWWNVSNKLLKVLLLLSTLILSLILWLLRFKFGFHQGVENMYTNNHEAFFWVEIRAFRKLNESDLTNLSAVASGSPFVVTNKENIVPVTSLRASRVRSVTGRVSSPTHLKLVGIDRDIDPPGTHGQCTGRARRPVVAGSLFMLCLYPSWLHTHRSLAR